MSKCENILHTSIGLLRVSSTWKLFMELFSKPAFKLYPSFKIVVEITSIQHHAIADEMFFSPTDVMSYDYGSGTAGRLLFPESAF